MTTEHDSQSVKTKRRDEKKNLFQNTSHRPSISPQNRRYRSFSFPKKPTSNIEEKRRRGASIRLRFAALGANVLDFQAQIIFKGLYFKKAVKYVEEPMSHLESSTV